MGRTVAPKLCYHGGNIHNYLLAMCETLYDLETESLAYTSKICLAIVTLIRVIICLSVVSMAFNSNADVMFVHARPVYFIVYL